MCNNVTPRRHSPHVSPFRGIWPYAIRYIKCFMEELGLLFV